MTTQLWLELLTVSTALSLLTCLVVGAAATWLFISPNDIEQRIAEATLSSIRMLRPTLLAPGAAVREFFGMGNSFSVRSLFRGGGDDASWAHGVRKRVKDFHRDTYERDARVVVRLLRWVNPTDAQRTALFMRWQHRRVAAIADPVVARLALCSDIDAVRAVTKAAYPVRHRLRDWAAMRALWSPLAAMALDMGGRGVTFGAALGAFVGASLRTFIVTEVSTSVYDWLVVGLGVGTLVGLVCGLSFFASGVMAKLLHPKIPRMLRARPVLFFLPFVSSLLFVGVYRALLAWAG